MYRNSPDFYHIEPNLTIVQYDKGTYRRMDVHPVNQSIVLTENRHHDKLSMLKIKCGIQKNIITPK